MDLFNDKVDEFVFELALEFPSDLEVESKVLMQTVIRAVFDYDEKHKLLPGIESPPTEERLVGTTISISRCSRRPNVLRALFDED